MKEWALGGGQPRATSVSLEWARAYPIGSQFPGLDRAEVLFWGVKSGHDMKVFVRSRDRLDYQ